MNRNSSHRRSRQTVVDAALALAVAVVAVVGSALVVDLAPAERPVDWLGFLLLTASAAMLVGRRRYPSIVLAGTTAVALVYFTFGYAGGYAVAPILVALYTAAAAGRRWQAVAVVGVFLAAALLASVGSTEPGIDEILWPAGWFVAVLVAGEVSRSRRAYLSEVEGRAAEAERTREEEARRRAGEERLRIARELHDVLSHSISMINVQASVAAHLMDDQPEQARSALLRSNRRARKRCRNCEPPSACYVRSTKRRRGRPRRAWPAWTT